jgi:hypothetical protein
MHNSRGQMHNNIRQLHNNIRQVHMINIYATMQLLSQFSNLGCAIVSQWHKITSRFGKSTLCMHHLDKKPYYHMHFSSNAGRPFAGHSTFIGWYQNRPNSNCCLNLQDSARTLEKSGVPDGGGRLLRRDRPAGAREEEDVLVEAAVGGVEKTPTKLARLGPA